jgi:outer membrane receptor for ferrienterochelin and colicins
MSPRAPLRLCSVIVAALAPAQAWAQPAGGGSPVSPASPAPTASPGPADAPADASAESGASPQPDPPAEPDVFAEEQEGEVIVVDSRTEKPLGNAIGAVEVVSREQIRARGARTVTDALRGRAGLEVVPGRRGTSVRTQGLDSRYLLILVDGLPMIGRIDGAIDTDRLSVDDIERIEVVKGPSSALYGSDALSGVVNIVTRDADRPLSSEGTATYGSRNRMDATATAAARQQLGRWRLGSRVTLGMRRTDGYDLDPATVGTDGAKERSGDVALRVSAVRGPWRVAIGGDYLRQDLRSLDSNDAIGAIYDHRTLSESGSGSVAATYRPREDTTVAATLRHSRFRDQYLHDQRRDPLYTYEPTDEDLTRGSVVGTTLLTTAHRVTGGVDGAHEELSAVRLSEDGSRERLGVYAQDEWLVLPSPQIVVAPGARLDLDSQFGVYATPKLTVRWDPTDELIVRAGGGLGYRAPDFRQLYLQFRNPEVGYQVIGNPDLEPETSIGGNVSAELEATETLTLAATGFWNEIDNLITILPVEAPPPDPDNPPNPDDPILAGYQYANVASARTRGVELHANLRLARRLTGSVSYTFTETLDRETDHAISDRARHRGSFEVRARPFDRLTLSAHGELVGERPFFTDDDERTEVDRADRYAWIGARAEVSIGDNTALHAGVENLADAGDREFLPIAPRAFYVGVRGHFEIDDEPARLTLAQAQP